MSHAGAGRSVTAPSRRGFPRWSRQENLPPQIRFSVRVAFLFPSLQIRGGIAGGRSRQNRFSNCWRARARARAALGERKREKLNPGARSGRFLIEKHKLPVRLAVAGADL